jgi:hypothetical protein
MTASPTPGFTAVNELDARLTHFERHSRLVRRRPDCVAGHVRFEPANPSASYLIGIT